MPSIKARQLSQTEKMKARRAELKADAASAMQEFQDGLRDTREKTERLRAQRLAREEAEAKAKRERKPATRKKRLSA
jgi:hypothetical protein